MKSLSKFIVLVVLSLVASLNFVSGFGVSIPYSTQDPLRLYPEQGSDVVVGLQSSISEGDLIIVPEISEGQDIVEITDSSKEYNVIANQPIGAAVHLKVNIPDNARVGEEYPVKLVFRDITPREGGMVGFSTSIGASFNVLVIEKPEVIKEEVSKKRIGIMLIILLIVVIIVILAIIAIAWFLIKRKK